MSSFESFAAAVAFVTTSVRIDDDSVTVSVTVNYVNDEPNLGYDVDSRRIEAAINAAAEANGLRFSDAGIEDDGSGEYWIFRARA